MNCDLAGYSRENGVVIFPQLLCLSETNTPRFSVKIVEDPFQIGFEAECAVNTLTEPGIEVIHQLRALTKCGLRPA
jgi:hypothetical protein